MNRTSIILAAGVAIVLASPASAGELFGGIHAHDVDTPLTLSGFEKGLGLSLGWRSGPIEALRAIGRPSGYAFASVNTAGDTNFAAAGLSWRFGTTFYVRPGIGLAVHNGSGRVVPGDNRIDFGSRVLVEPEVALGARVSDRMSIEASYIHLSHARLGGLQNPGLENLGVRLNYRFR